MAITGVPTLLSLDLELGWRSGRLDPAPARADPAAERGRGGAGTRWQRRSEAAAARGRGGAGRYVSDNVSDFFLIYFFPDTPRIRIGDVSMAYPYRIRIRYGIRPCTGVSGYWRQRLIAFAKAEKYDGPKKPQRRRAAAAQLRTTAAGRWRSIGWWRRESDDGAASDGGSGGCRLHRSRFRALSLNEH